MIFQFVEGEDCYFAIDFKRGLYSNSNYKTYKLNGKYSICNSIENLKFNKIFINVDIYDYLKVD